LEKDSKKLNTTMRKEYVKPNLLMVTVQAMSMIAATTTSVTSTSTNLEGNDKITYGGGSNVAARGRNNSVWDEDEE
jgi:hypothetical protein